MPNPVSSGHGKLVACRQMNTEFPWLFIEMDIEGGVRIRVKELTPD